MIGDNELLGSSRFSIATSFLGLFEWLCLVLGLLGRLVDGWV